MAYELVDDFQYINAQKQIMKLVKGTKLDNETDGYFIIKVKGKAFKLEKEVVLKNPDYFKKIDWVIELGDLLKKNRKATSPRLAKMIAEFLDVNVFKNSTLVADDSIFIMLNACRVNYYSTKDEKYLTPIISLGWSYNEEGVYPPK